MAHHETDRLRRPADPAILFVGDDERLLDGIRFATVQRSDYRTVRTTAVTEAIRTIRSNEPVVGVVCDLNTATDPIAFLEAVRVQEPALPFVLVGDHDEELAGRAFQAGVTEYLAGEKWIDALFVRLERAIEYYRSRRATMVVEPFRAERLEALPDAVGVIRDGSFVAANERLRDLVGVGGNTITEVAPADVVDPETLSVVRETDGIARRADGHLMRDGAAVPVDLTAARVEWGDEAATLIVCRSRAETASRPETHRQFRRAIETAGHAVYTTDRDETIQYVNAAFEETTGYTAKEALGETPRILKSGLMSEEYYEELWDSLLAGETWREVVTNRRKDGSLYHADQSIAPITDGGETVGFVAVQTDVTMKKEIEDDLRTFKSIVDRIEDPIMWQDLDGKYQVVNEAVADLAGCAKGELIGKDEFAFMDEATAERIQLMKRRALEREEPVSYEVSPALPNNGERTFATLRYPQYGRDGTPAGTLAICRDVTDLQRHEKQFRVIERMLRHNIRNDIQVVEGIAEIIGSEGSETVQSHVDRILKTGDELLETVDKERLITEVLADETPVRTVDLADVVTTVTERIRSDHPEADVTVDVPSDCRVSAIRSIDRAVEEILENAVVHADRADPSVDVRIDRTDGWAKLAVSDDGPGIPEMERDVLTGREDIGPLYHGRGIGMWMIRLIVRESDGKLDFTENEPRGSAVNVSLPLADME